MIKQLQKQFKDIFNTYDEEVQCFFAPGRINLIGEHIDYNGGYVFPAAISIGTYALVSEREDQAIHFYSLNMKGKEPIVCQLADLSYKKADAWANYPKGIFYYLQKAGIQLNRGLNIMYYGEIPNGAGLSSSASIEMVTAIALKQLFNLSLDMKELVLLGKKVENEYIGVNSGIMDQFSVGFGKKDHAILLDCHTLEHHYAPIELDNYKIMIIHTNKRRSLAESKYNERKQECENALTDLQEALDVHYLCEITGEQFEQYKHLIRDDLHRNRAAHVIYEHARTKAAYDSLLKQDLDDFGQLMFDSHDSLKHLYEVSGIELDTIVESAQQAEGVLGARMTGAGFGGCAIAIVEEEKIDQVKEAIIETYIERIGYAPSFYEADISDGPKQI